MTAIIIIGIIIFIIYAVSSKEKHKNIPSHKKFNVSNTANQSKRTNAKLMQENMTANLKIVDNIRIKCRSLGKIIEITYELKICPKCNERKMNFSNVAPTGQFITCQCSNCSKVQTFKLIAGKNGSKVIQVRDEIKHLMESIILPVTEDFWKIDIGNSFMVNTETDYISSKNNIKGNLDAIVKSDSIIDITPLSIKINSTNDLQKYQNGVPYWSHHYVYSYSEIYNATIEQSRFYAVFKDFFLKGEYLDLEGNTNYAFILMFDILNDYDNSINVSDIESKLHILGQYYPKTKSYGISFLIRKMDAMGDNDSIKSLKAQSNDEYLKNNSYQSFYEKKLGTLYRIKFGLNDEAVKLIDGFWTPNNGLFGIDYCCQEIIKLFLSTVSQFKNECIKDGTTIEQLFSDLADNVTRREYRLRKGNLQYNLSVISVNNGFYSRIFSYCECEVKDFLIYPKKKTKLEASYKALTVNELVQAKLYSKINVILSKEALKIAPPDESAEIDINAYYTKRWNKIFDEIKINFNNSPKLFIESIYKLGVLNKKNPSVENIFFEASKFIAASDKEAALTFYIHYLYHDLKSIRSDNKQLTKKIQKSLFKTNEQLLDFETIVSELIKDKDLDKALKYVSKVYEDKRKKIQLDGAAIKDVQQQLAGTVELLNEYLKDDFEDETNSIKSQEINNEEIKIEINQKREEIHHSTFVSELALTLIQTTALELFAKNNLSVAQSELEAFAKSKGIFKNQLIESINDTCYEFLDDLLIEEDDDYYNINTTYFQNISIK